jgi:MFS family permease
LVLLTAAAAAVAYARTALGPLQETMRVALDLSDNEMALLQGPALALPMILVAIPLGLAIDRYSRVRLLFAFAVLSAAGSLLTAASQTFGVLFAARCLVGLTATAASTTAFSLLADLYPPAQRGRASMIVVIGQYGGMSAAFLVGGYLLAVLGSGPSEWRWAMCWLSAPLVIAAFTTLAMHEPSRTGLGLSQPSTRASFAEFWQYRARILPLLAGLVIAEMGVMAVMTWAAPTLSRNFALTPDNVGALIAVIVLLSGILGPCVGGALADLSQRTGGPRRTIAVLSGLGFLSVPAGLFAAAPGVVSAGILLAVFMTIIGAILVTGIALFTIVIPNELRGLCLALQAAAGVVFGVALAPMAVSFLSGALGGPAMIGKALSLVCMSTSLVSAIALAYGRRHFPFSAIS